MQQSFIIDFNLKYFALNVVRMEWKPTAILLDMDVHKAFAFWNLL